MKMLRVLIIMLSLLLPLGFTLSCNSNGNGGGESLPDAFLNADMIHGGQLWDKWWAVTAAGEPAVTNPNYPTAINPNGRTGSQTWRCKECHGWDYLGVDGFYGPGSSHFTGVEGIVEATPDEPQEIYDVIAMGITGATGVMTGFAPDKLTDQDIWDLVKFVKEGLIDDMTIIDYDTNAAINPDLANGQAKFDGTCALCHGLDGGAIIFDGVETVANVANDNPVEFVHKVRFGQPGTTMPSSFDFGWTTNDVRDVLGYSQSLPLFGE